MKGIQFKGKSNGQNEMFFNVREEKKNACSNLSREHISRNLVVVNVWSPANHRKIHYEHRRAYHRLLKILYLINLSSLPECSDKFLGSGK